MSIVSLPTDRLAGPEQPAAEEIAAYVVAAAVWAPSVHNTQPWFSADGQELSLHADAGRQLRVADPRGREMMISCVPRSSPPGWPCGLSATFRGLPFCPIRASRCWWPG
jgi:hypothetical protein